MAREGGAGIGGISLGGIIVIVAGVELWRLASEPESDGLEAT